MPEASGVLIQQIKDVTVVTFQESRILDAAQVEEIGASLYALVDTMDRRRLIVDFSNVEFLSSALLGVLITLHNKSRPIQGEIVLCGLRPELHKVFAITKLDRMLAIVDNEARALAKFGITMTDVVADKRKPRQQK